MSRRDKKSKHANVARSSPGSARAEVERLLEKGQQKEAFKQAKILFNQHGTPEYRDLVERTYLSRIIGLIKGGMAEAAREVASSFFEFGVTSADVLQSLIPLLPTIGLVDKALNLQGQLKSPEAQAILALLIADRAVIRPQDTPPEMEELRQGASMIRAALAALDANEESHAMEALQAIPRSSPMADWRYFVRGLAAHRRQDMEQAQANWDRLDARRAPHKIAKTLQSMSNPTNSSAPPKSLAFFETREFGEPVLERIVELETAIKNGDWKRALQLITPIRSILRRLDVSYAQHLTEIVLGPLATELQNHRYEEAQRLCRNFMAALEPLPWDPQWHRFQALLWEGPQGSTHEAIDLWKKYVQDLEPMDSALGVKSASVQAAVWRRIGSMLASLEEDDEDDDDFYADDEIDLDDDFEPDFKFAPDGAPDDASDEEDPPAVQALLKSISLDPNQRKTYEQLIDVYEEMEDPEGVIATSEQLLAAFPNDVEVLRRLIRWHIKLDDAEPVLNYAEQIRKLKPLESQNQDAIVWAHLALARQLAIGGEWPAARSQLELAESLPHPQDTISTAFWHEKRRSNSKPVRPSEPKDLFARRKPSLSPKRPSGSASRSRPTAMNCQVT